MLLLFPLPAFITNPWTIAAASILASYLLQLLKKDEDAVGTSDDRIKTRIKRVASPARWIAGKASTAGVVAYADTRDATFRFTDGQDYTAKDAILDMAIVLSEGPINNIIGMKIDGEFSPIDVYTETGTGLEVFVPQSKRYNIKCYPYTAADGNGGQSLYRASGGKWSSNHKLNGLSWIHVVVLEGGWSEAKAKPTDPEASRVQYGGAEILGSLPEIEFVCEGIQFLHPAGSGFTENAAAIRYFYETEILGKPASDINTGQYLKAFKICDEVLTWPPKAGYKPTGIRYPAGGVFVGTDKVGAVNTALDFAFVGNVIFQDGKWEFLPGANTPPIYTLTESDIVEERATRLGLPIEANATVLEGELAQSIDHGYDKLSMSYGDAELTDLYGREFKSDIGSIPWVNSAYAVGRNLYKTLRLMHGDTLDLILRPTKEMLKKMKLGAMWSYKEKTWKIDTKNINSDLNTELKLIEIDNNTYKDIIPVVPDKGGRSPGEDGTTPGPNAVIEVGGTSGFPGYKRNVWEWKHGLGGNPMLIPDHPRTGSEPNRTFNNEDQYEDIWPYGKISISTPCFYKTRFLQGTRRIDGLLQNRFNGLTVDVSYASPPGVDQNEVEISDALLAIEVWDSENNTETHFIQKGTKLKLNKYWNRFKILVHMSETVNTAIVGITAVLDYERIDSGGGYEPPDDDPGGEDPNNIV